MEEVATLTAESSPCIITPTIGNIHELKAMRLVVREVQGDHLRLLQRTLGYCLHSVHIFVYCISGTLPFWICNDSIPPSPFPSPFHHHFSLSISPNIPLSPFLSYSTVMPTYFSTITLSLSSPSYLFTIFAPSPPAYCSVCPNHILQWTCRIPWRPCPLICP